MLNFAKQGNSSSLSIFFVTTLRKQFKMTILNNAKYYVSFVQAHVAGENQEHYERRMLMSSFTLTRLREEYGDLVEITLVEMYDTVNASYFQDSVNTIIDNTHFKGEDFSMHQIAVIYAQQRWKRFEWIILINDQQVLVADNFDRYLQETLQSGGNYWANSVWGGCCLRGFALAFSKKVILSEMWQNYWNRIDFIDGKVSSMFIGEGINRILDLGQCKTSTNVALGKKMKLSRMMELNTPLLYREGIEIEFAKKSQVELLNWLNNYRIREFQLKNCDLL
jgi:hypothetical protein